MEIGETCLSLVIPCVSLSAPFWCACQTLVFWKPSAGSLLDVSDTVTFLLRGSFRKEAQEETDTILKQEDHSIYSIVVRIK